MESVYSQTLAVVSRALKGWFSESLELVLRDNHPLLQLSQGERYKYVEGILWPLALREQEGADD